MLALLRRNRGFWIFLVTQCVSNLGNAVRNVAVPLFLLQLTHAPTLVAELAVLEIVPSLVLQLPVGALVDRWDRRRILLMVDLGRGCPHTPHPGHSSGARSGHSRPLCNSRAAQRTLGPVRRAV